MFRDVLVVVVGRQYDTRVIEHAIDLARQYGARLHVLGVVDESETAYADNRYGQLLQQRSATAVEDAVTLAAYHGLEAVTTVAEGPPSTVVLDYAREHDIDLIVIAVDGGESLGRYAAEKLRAQLFDDPADHVIHQARVPVVSIHV